MVESYERYSSIRVDKTKVKKASSRPTITIYPGDELRSPIWFCSLATHGLWLRLRLVAHDTERPGILSHLGEPITHELLARKCGTTLEAMIPALEEITRAGLIVKDTKGFYLIPDVINHEKKKSEWRKNKTRRVDFTASKESQENLKRISIESTPLSSSFSSSSLDSKETPCKPPDKPPVMPEIQPSEPPKQPDPKPPRKPTGVQDVVRAFKITMKVDENDKAWDKVYFRRYARPAADLLALFGGDIGWVCDCIEAVAGKLEKKGLSWTPETIVKHAGDFKNGRLMK